ncbi:MAG: signal peptidase II [Clostridia bacterium]|nr:signal peptidase II [Clostridia bacterium]
MARIISMVAIAVLTAVDQLIKFFVERDLQPVGRMGFIEGFIGWEYVRNTGAAFGSFSDNTQLLSVFTGAVIVVGIALLLMGRISSKFCQVCAVLIIAGGLGNLIDRILLGYVIDYIAVQFVNFAVFNFADILVTCGSFMLMGYMIYDIIREGKQKKAGDNNG